MPRRRPRRRPRKIPPAAVRRARSPQIPRGVELFYLRVLGNIARAIGGAVKRAVLPHVAKFAAQPTDERTDAEEEDDDVESVMSAARSAAEQSFNKRDLESGSRLASKRVLQHSKDEFERLGIDLVKDEPEFAGLFDEWRKASLARVKGVSDDQLDKIEKILKNGASHRAETLAEEIERQCDEVTASRVELIARDQVLTLNAKVTQHRQKAAGITSYVWSTSNDERVRETHADLEGEEFDWDDPPVINDDGDTGHPGEDIQCRCIAFPILPELGDDEDEDEGEPEAGGDEEESDEE